MNRRPTRIGLADKQAKGDIEDESDSGEDSTTDHHIPDDDSEPATRLDYFTQIATPSRTSSNVFSILLPPLSAEEYATATPAQGSRPLQSSMLRKSSYIRIFSQFFSELEHGFNLLFYGLGSKRDLINRFAKECAKFGDVVVVNGFLPDINIRDMLNAIDNIPAMSSLPPPAAGIESQTRRISKFFSRPSETSRLYIAVHNIDALAFRTPKSKSCLSLLALTPRIHLVASVDRITSPLIWSSTEMSTRKHSMRNAVSSQGFAWLMHDLTTLSPYDIELLYADRTSISGAHNIRHKQQETTIGMAPSKGVLMTETAASHILASVTQKAKKLFALMGSRQLEQIEEAGDPGLNDLQPFGIGYDMLFNLARDEFLAPNDTVLRSLLAEFRDHGLVLSAQGDSGSGEVMWIPLRKDRLGKVLQSLR